MRTVTATPRTPKAAHELVQRALDLEVRLLRGLVPAATDAWLELDLTMPQLKVLIDLARLRDARVSELAAALQVSPPTASGIIDRLFRRGLVRRREAIEDRRATLVSLTKQGEAAVRRLFAASRTELQTLLRDLDEPELVAVVRSLELLVRSAERTQPSTAR